MVLGLPAELGVVLQKIIISQYRCLGSESMVLGLPAELEILKKHVLYTFDTFWERFGQKKILHKNWGVGGGSPPPIFVLTKTGGGGKPGC